MFKLLVLLFFVVSNTWALPDPEDISASYAPSLTEIFHLKNESNSEDGKCVSAQSSAPAASPEFFLLTGNEQAPVQKNRFSLPPSRASPASVLI
jgi:hypothetical protein